MQFGLLQHHYPRGYLYGLRWHHRGLSGREVGIKWQLPNLTNYLAEFSSELGAEVHTIPQQLLKSKFLRSILDSIALGNIYVSGKPARLAPP